ncbi:hypothetical protein HYPSUDRAFT_664574 [Hypholoma sublateritium FD-334 SS-4]|uniref:Uncharacterized protein n=1 Tax=Hypholoma sublateritium (strain FD-334 SS-4) TaxID=945553 RepID=A0A0D2NTC3_HYPSF|nr:hypothetical protein HYPSUDRAFT_664574 [Hypholoma sublateritium FD-334 SS-4]
MPTFAELKAKAAGAANTGKEKFNNVRDRNTSVPMAKTNWDPYSGESAPPPPPPRSLVNNSTKPKPLAPLPPPPSRTSSAALSASSTSQSRSVSPSPPAQRGPVSSAPPPPPRTRATGPLALPPRTSAASHSDIAAHVPSPAAGGGPPPIVRSTRPGINPRRVTPTIHSETDTIDWTNLTPEDKQVFFSWLDEFFANFAPPPTVKPDNTGSVGGVSQHSHGPPPLRASTKPSTWSHPSAGCA